MNEWTTLAAVWQRLNSAIIRHISFAYPFLQSLSLCYVTYTTTSLAVLINFLSSRKVAISQLSSSLWRNSQIIINFILHNSVVRMSLYLGPIPLQSIHHLTWTIQRSNKNQLQLKTISFENEITIRKYLDILYVCGVSILHRRPNSRKPHRSIPNNWTFWSSSTHKYIPSHATTNCVQ